MHEKIHPYLNGTISILKTNGKLLSRADFLLQIGKLTEIFALNVCPQFQ